MPAEKKVLAFDIYGTLLDTGAIAQAIQKYVKEIEAADQAKALAASWRTYQLEYTWRLNSMGDYLPLDAESALNCLLRRSVRTLRRRDAQVPAQRRRRCQHPADRADARAAHAGVPRAAEFRGRGVVNKEPPLPRRRRRRALQQRNGRGTHRHGSHITTNHGPPSKQMVAKSITAAALPITLSRYLANSAKKYKPCREIYHGLVQFLGVQDRVQDVWLVSGNPFDVAGARAFGLNAIWVDRAGKGWNDRLLDIGPSRVVGSVEEIARLEAWKTEA